MLTDFVGLVPCICHSKAWSFPRCDPACCWERVGSEFVVGCCDRWWRCGWIWESPICAPSHPSQHTSACSLTLLILHLFVLFIIITIFPKTEEVPDGKRGTSLLSGCPLLGSSSGVPSRKQAAADPCEFSPSRSGMPVMLSIAWARCIPTIMLLEPKSWSRLGVHGEYMLVCLTYGSI